MDSCSQLVVASRGSLANIKLTSSSLLGLPAEILNRIYDFLFCDLDRQVVNIVRSSKSILPRPTALFGPRKGLRAPDLALRLSCRKFNKEVTSYRLQDCNFGIFLRRANARRHDRAHVLREITGFATLMSAHIGFLRHLELGLDDFNLFFEGLVSTDPTPLRSGTARQQYLQNLLGSPSEPDSGVTGLQAVVKILPCRKMNGIHSVTLHANHGHGFRLNDPFFTVLKYHFKGLEDFRLISTVPVPYGTGFRVICSENFKLGRYEEWYSREVTFSWDFLANFKKASE